MRTRGITIEQLSEAIGVTENFISKMIAGYAPIFHRFIKIAEALGVGSDYLIQDYIPSAPDVVTNPADILMAKAFFELSEPQKSEVLHLTNFLRDENNP